MKNRVGILGGGQLGRMLALAGYPLGLEFCALEPADNAPIGKMATQLRYEYNDHTALEILAYSADVVTFEFENVAIETAEFLEKKMPVYPPARALRVSQERLTEKQYLSDLGIPVPDFYPIDSPEDAHNAIITTGLPAILKTRRMGYDGKGQILVNSVEEIIEAFEKFNGVPLLLEEKVDFNREVSIIAVRSKAGNIVFYPLIENLHKNGMLLVSKAPAMDIHPAQKQLAQTYAAKLLEALDYVGVLTIEFFDVKGKLVANEFAPRVHNSGHWTIEGAEISQFENHIRAIVDLPLGSTANRGFSGMVNIIGQIPNIPELLKLEGVHLHLYDKEPRPSRKLGHVTVCRESREEAETIITALLSHVVPVY
jgi:5-(carboxyamino)imidazole ribonucleotide synthase